MNKFEKQYGSIDKNSSKGTLSVNKWFLVAMTAVITFSLFLYLDPNPNILLAACSALNIGIMLWAIFHLFQMRLLLSPMAAVIIGPAWIIQYSLGNLLARMAGESRFGSNPESLAFYPSAAFLTTIGLVLFCVVCFGIFGKHIQYYRIRYENLSWQPWQALASSLLAVAVLAYLSSKYEFINGYFRYVEGQFDAGLAASSYFFVILASVVGVSVLLNAKSGTATLMGLTGVVFPLFITLGLRSRTFMIADVVTVGLCWLTLKPQHIQRVLAVGFIGALAVYLLGSVVKELSMKDGGTFSIAENFRVLSNLELNSLVEINALSSSIDAEYHLAGYEFPATLLLSIHRGATPAYGKAIIGGALAGLPRFLRPVNLINSERLAIYKTFYGKGLRYGDTIGILLTSGIADWGLFGPLIYIVVGLYCVALWRIVQISPRLFMAYLIVGAGIGDLFWDNVFFNIRALSFVWLILIALEKFIMPKWTPQETPITVEPNTKPLLHGRFRRR